MNIWQVQVTNFTDQLSNSGCMGWYQNLELDPELWAENWLHLHKFKQFNFGVKDASVDHFDWCAKIWGGALAVASLEWLSLRCLAYRSHPNGCKWPRKTSWYIPPKIYGCFMIFHMLIYFCDENMFSFCSMKFQALQDPFLRCQQTLWIAGHKSGDGIWKSTRNWGNQWCLEKSWED